MHKVILAVAAAAMFVAPAQAAASGLEAVATGTQRTCEDVRKPAGGDWPVLNHDLGNTRDQPAETVIGTADAPRLSPAWSFAGAQVGAPGGMRSTPVVAQGCVYIGLGQGYLGDRGDIVALDAATGALVWHVRLNASVLGLTVANGMVYAAPSMGTRGDAGPGITDSLVPAGSYAIGIDARTGQKRWTSRRLDDGTAANGTFINATPVAYAAGRRKLVFVPLAGGSGDGARVPMYFLDARNGKTIRKAFSMSEAEYQQGYGGTGIWSTAAYDPEGRHLYAGTADSDGHTRQHRYNNAILKIDADPRRASFGSVIGSYSGISEHADLDKVVGYPDNPACGGAADAPEIDPPAFVDRSAATECLELDFDFGASPLLHRAGNRLRISALQKAGVFHSVDTGSMLGAWRFFVGPGGPFHHAGTAALAGGRIAVGATPNFLFGLSAGDGAMDWVSQTGLDFMAYQPLTSANGVLYAINDFGSLLLYEAATGSLVTVRDIASDGGFAHCFGVGAGVAVAHNTVFAPCDAGAPTDAFGLPSDPGGVVAYRLP